VSSATSGFGLLVRVVVAVVVGAVSYLGSAALLGGRAARRAIEKRPLRSAGRIEPPGPLEPPRSVDDGNSGNHSPESFRDRLDDRSVDLPHRHLRPVSSEPGDEEEDVDGPDPGGDR
jgi:hypothetical protein